MNLKVLTRTIFALVGVYLVLIYLGSFLPLLALIFNNLHLIPTFVGLLALLFFIVRFLIVKPDKFINLIVSESTPSNDQPVDWLYAAYRLAFLITGILILADCVTSLFSLFNSWYAYKTDFPADQTLKPSKLWFGIFSTIIRTAVGIYLVLGAPQFLRWHINEIRQSESKNLIDA